METKRKILFTYNKLSEKEAKNLEILGLIKKRGVISRTDISKITGINIVSVSNYIKNYIDKKLVLEKGFGISSGGRKPELVELNIKENYIIGADIGDAEVRVSLADLGMNIIEKAKVERQKSNVQETVSGIIEETIKKSKIDARNIRAVGLGISDNSLISIGTAIEKKFGVEVFFAGPASCAAFGERCLNPNADVKDLLYMHSDIGRGIVIKGITCFGSAGSNGEIRVLTEKVPKELEDEFYEQSKYLRPWNRSLGIAYMAKQEVARGIGTKIVDLANGQIENIAQELVIKAAMENDDVASNIIHSVGINLGLRISYLINLFNPEAVVIGGGIERAGDLILGPIKKIVQRLAFSKQASTVKIMPGTLGDDAISLGAASIAIREIFLKV